MADYQITQYDELPSLQCQLGFEGVADAELPAIPVDATVTCLLKPPGNSPAISATAVVVDAAKRIVRRDIAENEITAIGTWEVQWRVNYANGKEQTHPTGAPQTLEVHKSLGGSS